MPLAPGRLRPALAPSFYHRPATATGSRQSARAAASRRTPSARSSSPGTPKQSRAWFRGGGPGSSAKAIRPRHVEHPSLAASRPDRPQRAKVHPLRRGQPDEQPALGPGPGDALDSCEVLLHRDEHGVTLHAVDGPQPLDLPVVTAVAEQSGQDHLVEVRRAEVVVPLEVEHRLDQRLGQDAEARLHAGAERLAERPGQDHRLATLVVPPDARRLGIAGVGQAAIGGVLKDVDRPPLRPPPAPARPAARGGPPRGSGPWGWSAR